MSTLREAAQQALEAMEQRDNATLWHQATHALRDALAQEEHPKLAPAPGWCKHCRQYTVEEPLLAQQEQEPVAWMTHGDNTLPLFHKTLAAALGWGACPTPLYAHPPRREWQGLSDKEISAMFPAHLRGDYKDLIPYSFARAIERALKEKNNG